MDIIGFPAQLLNCHTHHFRYSVILFAGNSFSGVLRYLICSYKTVQLTMNTKPQHYCLKWNNYQSHVAEIFTQLLQAESMVDVTLCAEGHKIHAHRIVLSACSPYFQVCYYYGNYKYLNKINVTKCVHGLLILVVPLK